MFSEVHVNAAPAKTPWGGYMADYRVGEFSFSVMKYQEWPEPNKREASANGAAENKPEEKNE